MALRESTHQADADLFRLELINMIDLRHELFALTAKIDWPALEIKFSGLYAAGLGRPDHPLRLMGGCNGSSTSTIAAMKRLLVLGSITPTSSTSAESNTFATTCPLIPV